MKDNLLSHLPLSNEDKAKLLELAKKKPRKCCIKCGGGPIVRSHNVSRQWIRKFVKQPDVPLEIFYSTYDTYTKAKPSYSPIDDEHRLVTFDLSFIESTPNVASVFLLLCKKCEDEFSCLEYISNAPDIKIVNYINHRASMHRFSEEENDHQHIFEKIMNGTKNCLHDLSVKYITYTCEGIIPMATSDVIFVTHDLNNEPLGFFNSFLHIIPINGNTTVILSWFARLEHEKRIQRFIDSIDDFKSENTFMRLFQRTAYPVVSKQWMNELISKELQTKLVRSLKWNSHPQYRQPPEIQSTERFIDIPFKINLLNKIES